MSRRLGFSTLGCSGATVAQIIRFAQDGRAPGVELRSAADEVVNVGLSAAAATEIGGAFRDEGVEVLCVASYVGLCSVDDVDDDLDRNLDLARRLGAGGVRVFMKDEDAVAGDALTPGEERAIERLSRVAGSDIPVLIETHDSHSSARRLARFLQAADATVTENPARVLWDTAHSWSHGETPAESLADLMPWLAHLQIKDERSLADPVPVALGDGSYPVAQLAAALDAAHWSGWLALEWERKWHPTLPPLDAALVAAHDWAAPLFTTEGQGTL
ncbi:sugar phosphate isomerase/epimerase family protein [Leifsonia sp. NPDC058230]|uniref:sugar phosphate isomerase/epimerase family protein n=1 Tax=Leifsonia sp. NPDC058230 TaxID=3346391 RepID=UPI0036DD0BDF